MELGPLVERGGALRPEALRTAPKGIPTEATKGTEVPPDVLIAAADSGLAMNARVLGALRRSAAKPQPVLSDYTVARDERRVLSQLRHHFDLVAYLESRSFKRNVLALQRELGRTEIKLIRQIGSDWHATAPETFRRQLQTALGRAPEEVAALALPLAHGGSGRLPLAVVYATGAGHAQRYLRAIVSGLRRRLGEGSSVGAVGASVVAAVARPEVFANLRIRRRALLLVGEPRAELLEAVRAAAKKEGEARGRRALDWGHVRGRRMSAAPSSHRTSAAPSSHRVLTPHRARPERRQYAGRGRYMPRLAKTTALMSRR